jgi:phosphoglycerol transferase MdoB-like AlkP superfamily enzyme
MTKAISDFFFNPILIIYYFFMGIDFKFENKKNILYFILNLILSIIIVFCGCVYSELFIIYHFNLEKDTHMEVSRRASIFEGMVEDKELLSIN